MNFVLIANRRVLHRDEESAVERINKQSKYNEFNVATSKSTIETIISFNNGATWDKLEVPGSDQQLNLYLEESFSSIIKLPQITSVTNQGAGIIIANGNLGESLSTDLDREFNTYLTIDGGLTWKQIKEGVNSIKVIE